MQWNYTEVVSDAQDPAISTDTTRPYTAIIPDMTTGMSDWQGINYMFAYKWARGTHLHDKFRLERSKASNSYPCLRCAKGCPDGFGNMRVKRTVFRELGRLHTAKDHLSKEGPYWSAGVSNSQVNNIQPKLPRQIQRTGQMVDIETWRKRRWLSNG